MRCGSRLIAVEARASELLSVCGEPAYRDVWSPLGAPPPDVVAEQEEWTYNFGPNQLLRLVLLRNGQIVDIGSEGYGLAETQPGERRCAPEQLLEGMSKYRLLMVCGAPLTRQMVQGYRPYRIDRYGRRHDEPLIQVFREEWVYDFGPNLFTRVLTLENGRVVDIENGARGMVSP